jgi:hypothetical protein
MHLSAFPPRNIELSITIVVIHKHELLTMNDIHILDYYICCSSSSNPVPESGMSLNLTTSWLSHGETVANGCLLNTEKFAGHLNVNHFKTWRNYGIGNENELILIKELDIPVGFDMYMEQKYKRNMQQFQRYY